MAITIRLTLALSLLAGAGHSLSKASPLDTKTFRYYGAKEIMAMNAPVPEVVPAFALSVSKKGSKKRLSLLKNGDYTTQYNSLDLCSLHVEVDTENRKIVLEFINSNYNYVNTCSIRGEVMVATCPNETAQECVITGRSSWKHFSVLPDGNFLISDEYSSAAKFKYYKWQ